MDDDTETLWDFVDRRQLHIFRSENGYWVAFDPETELLGRGSSSREAVSELRRLLSS